MKNVLLVLLTSSIICMSIVVVVFKASKDPLNATFFHYQTIGCSFNLLGFVICLWRCINELKLSLMHTVCGANTYLFTEISFAGTFGGTLFFYHSEQKQV